jgi:hypothetical protein
MMSAIPKGKRKAPESLRGKEKGKKISEESENVALLRKFFYSQSSFVSS